MEREGASSERGLHVPFTCPCGRRHLLVITIGDERSPNAFGERILKSGAFPGQPPHLSPFEQRVLSLVADGLSDREISQELGVSVHSVKRAVRACLVRLAARNRTEAAMRATAFGLLAPVSPTEEFRQ